MGLYDDRLNELSEPRRVRGVASPRLGPRPFSPSVSENTRKPMRVQSLLFGVGWTEAKAKSWAKAHGYKHGKVDVTDQYVRIRQFDSKGLKVKRTITLGRGIRAVVAREENMKRRAKAKATHRRRTRKSPAAAKPTRRKRRRAVREAAPRTRRRSSLVMEAKRPRKRRRAKRRVVRAWRGDSAGHRKAAKKGHRRRKARRHVTREVVAAPRRRRAKHRRSRKHVYAAAPRRRKARRHHAREATVVHAKRRRSSRRRSRGMFAFASRRSGGSGMSGTQFAVAAVAGGIGFIAADALDRFLATYNPAGTGEKPKDKFTSDGAGTLANTLNLAATPNLYRIGAGVGMAALPAVASMFVKNPLAKSSLEGMAIGAGIKLLSTFWNNVVMGHLLTPKDTSVDGLRKSVIARLYPAEIAAGINQKQTPPNLNAAAATANGSLSGGDVGPFAGVAGSSDYPDAAQALRQQAGVHGEFPTLQNVWGTGGPSSYPSAAQSLHNNLHGGRYGVGADSVPAPTSPVPAPQMTPTSYQPGPPDGPGPGPNVKPHADCGCIGEDNAFLGFVGDPGEDTLYNGVTKAA